MRENIKLTILVLHLMSKKYDFIEGLEQRSPERADFIPGSQENMANTSIFEETSFKSPPGSHTQ